MSLWSNIWKHLFSGSSCAETLLWQKLLIPTPFYLESISFLLISATLLHLSTIPSCMLLLARKNEQARNGNYYFRWKLYLYSSPSHLTPENLVSPSAFRRPFFCFFSFSLFGLLRPLLQICRVWLTQTHQKTLNQVTLSNKHMNYLFWAWGNLVHYRVNPQQVFIFRCVYFVDQKKDADRSATVACAVWHSQE